MGPKRPAAVERGQSMVEFALVIVPLLLVVMGVLDLGRAVLASHLLAAGARDGARVAINPAATANEICIRAAEVTYTLRDVPAATGCGTFGPLNVALTRRGTPGSASDPALVTLTYRFSPVTPLVAPITGAFDLRATSSMVVEQ